MEIDKLDIRVGDRVTYIFFDKILTEIITDETDRNNLLEELQNEGVQIIKIERPKYEVIEEKKELLTEEEREFLRIYEKVMKFRITEIEKEDNRLCIWDMGSNYEIEIDESVFKNLDNEKTYNAEELGLEE